MLKVGTFSGHNTDLIQIAATLSVKVPGYPYIKYALPKWIIWLLAPFGKLKWIIPKHEIHTLQRNYARDVHLNDQ